MKMEAKTNGKVQHVCWKKASESGEPWAEEANEPWGLFLANLRWREEFREESCVCWSMEVRFREERQTDSNSETHTLALHTTTLSNSAQTTEPNADEANFVDQPSTLKFFHCTNARPR